MLCVAVYGVTIKQDEPAQITFLLLGYEATFMVK